MLRQLTQSRTQLPVKSAHVINTCSRAKRSCVCLATATIEESSSKKDFQWTDDEVEFLLHSTHLFKVKKEMECKDWEAAKTKVSSVLNANAVHYRMIYRNAGMQCHGE